MSDEAAESSSAGTHLTPTEQRLWHALRGQPGQAFTRGELCALVMPGAVVEPRTIDVHIRALRRKLGTAARQIFTVRNVGYLFCPAADIDVKGRP